MRKRAYAQPDDIDITALWAVVRRSFPRLLTASAIVGLGTYVALSLVAPRYESEALIVIASKSSGNPFSDPARAASNSDSISVRMDKEAVNTHVRALQSPDLAAEIARQLNLADRVEFNSALGSPDTLSAILRVVGIGAPTSNESEQDRVLNAYFKRLEVYSTKESRAIGIRFWSIDADLAAKVANAIAEAYREKLASQSVTETVDVQAALEPKIQKLAEEQAAAEAEADRFRSHANIFKGGQQATGLNEQQLGELTAELTKIKAARGDAEARAANAREMMKVGGAEALPDVQKSPLVQNLVQQRVRLQRQVSELSASLLPGHPRMRQLNADLTGLKRQIDDEVAKVIDSLSKEARVAALREEALVRSLDEVKVRVVSTGPDEAKLRSLEDNAKSKRAELERLRSQFEANRVRADGRAVPVEAQIVSTARPSSTPSFPKKLSLSALMAMATLLFGTALNITRGLLFGAARRPAGPMTDRDPVRATAGPQEAPAARAYQPEAPTSPPALAPTLAPAPAAAAAALAQSIREAASAVAPPSAAAPARAEPEPELPAAELAGPELPMPDFGTEDDPGGADYPELAAFADDAAPVRRLSVAKMASLTQIAYQLEGLMAPGGGGIRTLITGEADEIDPVEESTKLCKLLAAQDRGVIVVDWAPDGDGIAALLGAGAAPGMAELLADSVRFEDVVMNLGHSDAHFIAPGQTTAALGCDLDPERVNVLLDALDQAYDHIVVVGRREAARRLFEAIQGRFDCGISISDAKRRVPVPEDAPDTFLGFEVEGIELVIFERPPAELSAGDRAEHDEHDHLEAQAS